MGAQSSFGEWLRARRKALDLTQFDLAELAGCAEDTIGRIEAGTRRPSKQVAALLAEALGVPAQSQADFVRFAREGGSGAGLGSLEVVSRADDAPGSAQSLQHPGRSATPPAAWVPYLSSLPQSPTPLIGREAELAAAVGLLSAGRNRLLTLTGPPGVGKTRLALAVASALIPAFPDGVCFVPLAPLRDPDFLALTVAHALGLSDTAGGPHAERMRLLDFLRHKRLLLVLDNFEHILEATQQVAEWLSASAHLQVLATSRSALHLRGERLFPVGTLPVPSIAHINSTGPVDISALAGYPSVALFVERAQAVDPYFNLTESNSRVVAELCRRMEGLPLAIELAAARSARLAPENVLGRLGRRLDVVTSAPRDMPHHQRTLRAAIEWSYELLGQPERTLFARMSAFAGGATLDALEAVCNAREDIEGGLDVALEGLLQQSLVYASTVAAGKGEDAQATRRFSMLEMLHEYAAERLAEGEAEAIRRFHAEYYLAMAEAAELQKWSAEQEQWLDRLGRDHGNLRSDIQWALDSGHLELAGGLCGALWNFWRVRGYLTEGRSWLDKVLAHEAELSPHTLARVLNGAGVLARSQGEYVAAVPLLERSLEIFRQLEDRHGLADCLNNLGVTLFYMDRADRAEKLYEESIQVWRSLGENVGISKPIHNLGLIAQRRHDYVRAAHAYRQSLAIERANKEKGGMCFSLYNLGVVLSFLPGGKAEDSERPERYFAESLTLASELGNKSLVAMCLIKLGELALQPGNESRLTEATALFEDGLAVHKELGDRGSIAYTLNDLGYVALLRGDWTKAHSLFKESLRLSQAMEGRGYIAMNLAALAATEGATALALGDSDGALAEEGARRALQLLAASEAIFDVNLIPAKQRIHAATFEAVTSVLAPTELARLQLAGQQMSMEEAIEFATALAGRN